MNARCLTWCAYVLFVATLSLASAHPHDDPEIIVLRGTLTKVDSMNRTVALNVIASSAMPARNVSLFLTGSLKIRDGKTRLEVTELRPGQLVRCTVERRLDAIRGERLIAFEIELEPRP